jgi:hypothetical protein
MLLYPNLYQIDSELVVWMLASLPCLPIHLIVGGLGNPLQNASLLRTHNKLLFYT